MCRMNLLICDPVGLERGPEGGAPPAARSGRPQGRARDGDRQERPFLPHLSVLVQSLRRAYLAMKNRSGIQGCKRRGFEARRTT